jgi:hypothetical protein
MCRIGYYNVHVSLEHFAKILELPCNGQCAYSEEFDLNSFFEIREDEGPYRIYVPSSAKIIESICQTSNTLHPNKIRISELRPSLQAMAIIQRENVFCLIKDREYVPACCTYMLYCIINNLIISHISSLSE